MEIFKNIGKCTILLQLNYYRFSFFVFFVLFWVFLHLLFDFSNTTLAIQALQCNLQHQCATLCDPLCKIPHSTVLKQRIYQMAAKNSQVAKRSLGDSGISAAGFLSGPEESGCSLSNWITGPFLISKGCELSRGLAWWNQSGSWNRREKNNKSFLKVPWHRPSS